MKKTIYLITLNILYSALCFAAIPVWKLNLEKQFPSEKYVRAIGEGATESTAKKSALAELSAYFSQTIIAETESYQKIRQAGAGNGTSSDLWENVIIHSDTELFCVRYTAAWTEPKSKKVFVCAFIDRKEAWDLITQKMKGLEDKCNHLSKLADNEKESFKKLLILTKIRLLYSEYSRLYEKAVALFPKRGDYFEAFIRKMEGYMNKLMLLKASTAIQVKVSGDKGNSIYTKLSELLTRNGFLISSDGRYQLSATVNWNEAKQNEVYSAYPNIKILITGNGRTFASFNGECEKVAAYNQESMQRSAIFRLEELLEESFIKECFE
ncbi:MAG: LPP20 family lipoprotein [Treponema sp.]|nr:LPP20 family lipoprotein [Treponema sp.]